MNDKALVTNIQRFSLHDGPGIRTTVFLKGCSLHCPWCANPENLIPYPEEYVKDGRKGIYGKYLSCDEIYSEIIKDRIFYDQPDESSELGVQRGGVTFSGGEPLLQFNVLEPLLQRLKSENIHICVETSLFVAEDKLSIALRYVDLFYVDIKIFDEDKCKNILGGNLKQYVSNLDILVSATQAVVFRAPIIGGYTDDEENLASLCDLVSKYRSVKIELIKEHNLGKNKYISLGKEPLELNKTTDEKMEYIKSKLFDTAGVPIEICKV